MMCVDWDRLNELKADIGEEDFLDVATLFVSELQETLSGLSADFATAADFHFLRGSAANLGLAALVEACAQAEKRAKAGTPPDVDAVKAAFAAGLSEMMTQIPELAVAA